MEPQTSSKSSYVLPVSILVAAFIVAGAIVYSVERGKSPSPRAENPGQLGQAQPSNNGDISKITDRDVILGDPKAPVTVVEYGDYQCPFCGRFFTGVESSLRADYVKTGKVKMIFRNFAFLGTESTAAAEAAECAKDQHQFWAYHDALYVAEMKDGRENNGNLTPALFTQIAKDLKLDVPAFTSCLASNKYADQIAKDTAAGQAFGVNSTPTSFVNGVQVQGAVPYSQFKPVVEKALQGN